MTIDEILKAIDVLSKEERDRALALIVNKYQLFKGNTNGTFVTNWDWWDNENDDIYDK